MSYCTIDDIRKQVREAELIGLTDEEDTGAVVESVVTAAIESAGVEIDGYLGGRYALPLVTVPAILTKLAADIAVYNLYALGDGPPESRKERYDNAVRFLRSVAEGKISLGANDPAGTGTADKPTVSAGEAVFSQDSLKGF